MSRYNFPPPDMKRGCYAFLSFHSDAVISALIQRNDSDRVENDICYLVTKVP